MGSWKHDAYDEISTRLQFIFFLLLESLRLISMQGFIVQFSRLEKPCWLGFMGMKLLSQTMKFLFLSLIVMILSYQQKLMIWHTC